MKLNTERITRFGRFWDDVNVLAKEAFPPEEYLAPSELVKMAEESDFDFLALTDHDAFVGFMAVKIYREMAHLFFLAIAPAFRSKGYGSRAIETLRAAYPGKKQVVDFEMPDATADNSEQREKRRTFYLKNGYHETGLFLTYFGVSYEVFCEDEDFDPEMFKAMMKTIRIEGFEPKYVQGNHETGPSDALLTKKKNNIKQIQNGGDRTSMAKQPPFWIAQQRDFSFHKQNSSHKVSGSSYHTEASYNPYSRKEQSILKSNPTQFHTCPY